jgi:NDP-sugar pyrophosphorylase family protein
MEPEVLEHIPEGSHFDFPDLVATLLEENMTIGAYRSDDLWFDIGRPEDYERAVTAWGHNGHANGNGHDGEANGSDGHVPAKQNSSARSRKTRKGR